MLNVIFCRKTVKLLLVKPTISSASQTESAFLQPGVAISITIAQIVVMKKDVVRIN